MKRDDPGRCLNEPHVWSAWSLWTALQPRPAVAVISDAAPEPDPIYAYRERLCRRCGVREQEDYQHNRKPVADPHGIANRLEKQSG